MLDLRKNTGLLYALPGLLVVIFLVIYPVSSILQLSFTTTDDEITALTFEHFTDVIESRNFGRVVNNTITWVIATVISAYLLGLGAALLLNQEFVQFRGLWRSIIMLAWIVPSVVKATIWKWMYSADFGILNHMLLTVGILEEPVRWLTSTSLALPAVMVVQVWSTFPFAMLMIDAGLQSIPSQLYEAAELDGANAFQRLWSITLPSLSNVIFIVLLILAIWSLNEFATIWIMTQGGPAGRSQVLALSIYKEFQAFDMNAAAATSMLQLTVSAALAFVYILRSDEGDTAS